MENLPKGGRPAGVLAPVPSADLAWLLGVDQDGVDDALGQLIPGARAATASVDPLPHTLGSPATHGVYRVRGRGKDDQEWSLFCKVLQHLKHWPGLAMMPPQLAQSFAADFPWRSELDLWHPRVQASLPPGLRSPVLHRLIELGDDRVAAWQEDIAQPAPFRGLDQFALAARLLGRWNARSTGAGVLALAPYPPNYALRMYAEHSVRFRGLLPLADDALWTHPWLAPHGDLRSRLRDLGDRIPAMLETLDAATLCLPHGDASPQNLLVPSDDSAAFIVIALSFRAPHALGFDLGQLLVGLIHEGKLPAAMLPAIADVIVPAYLEGLAVEGVTGEDDAVRRSFALATMLRSGFDSMLYDLIGSDDPADRHTFAERVALTSFISQLV